MYVCLCSEIRAVGMETWILFSPIPGRSDIQLSCLERNPVSYEGRNVIHFTCICFMLGCCVRTLVT